MKRRILVIAAHPDDETLGCGGAILKHKENGDDVFWLILTKANQKITTIKNIDIIQKNYVEEVAKEYKFDETIQFDFLTTELEQYPIGELVSSISQVFNSVKPEILYCNHYSDIHSDHRIAFDAVSSCTKNFRYPFINKIMLYETLSETEFSLTMSSNAFIPNVFSDISPFMERKLEIMKLFTTEQMEEPYPRALSTIKALGRYRGSRIGVKYAEAFQLIFEKL